MTVWTSVFWKITIQLAKKWPEMVLEKSFTSIIHFYSDYMWFVCLSCTPVKCQNQLEMSTLIYVFGQIANIASRCGVYIFRMWYNLLPWYMYIHDFQCKFCNGPILNDNVGLFFCTICWQAAISLDNKGPNTFWSSMRANSIYFSRNMCTFSWNIGKF